MTSRRQTPWHQQRGFTIVELLIVIVVIGILAAITIVAYNGIQQRAANDSIISATHHYRQALLEYYAEYGAYPLPSDVPGQNGQQGWWSMCVGDDRDYPASGYFLSTQCSAGTPLNHPAQGNVVTSHQLQQILSTYVSTLPDFPSITDAKSGPNFRGIIYTPWYGGGAGNQAQLEYELAGKNSQCAPGYGNAGYLQDGVRCTMMLN